MTRSPSDQSEVVITGAGLHGAFGGLADTLAALRADRSAIGPVTPEAVDGFDPVPGARAAAWDPFEQLADRKLRKYMNPVTELAVLCAGRALASAGLTGDAPRRAAMDLYVATGLIAFDLAQLTPLHGEGTTPDGRLDLHRMGERGIRACHPLLPFKMLLNMPLGLVSIVHGVKGENFILYPDAGQAAICLEKACRAVAQGRTERALAGGSVQQLSLLPLASLRRQGRLAPSERDARREGDQGHGLAPADAGAFLVIESGPAAAARAVRPLARVSACLTAPTPEALWRQAAGHEPAEVVWSTGELDAAADRRVEDLARAAWPGSELAFARPDRQLGHAGAAALPATLALACGDGDRAGRAAVVSRDEAGRAAMILLDRGPAGGRTP